MGKTNESIGFGVDIETTEARAALAQLRQEADETRKALTRGASSMTTGSKATVDYGEALRKAEPKIGKVATGVSGLAGTMGGAVGQTNALTGAVGNLAGAFAGGGLLAVGISVAVVGLGALVEGFTKAKKEAAALALEAEGLGNVAVVSFGGEASKELDALRSSNREALGISASKERTLALTSQLVKAEKDFADASDEALRIEKLLEKHSRGKLYISTRNLATHKENLVVARAAEENAQDQLVHLDTERRVLTEISKEYEDQLALSRRLKAETKARADAERRRARAISRWKERMREQDRLDGAAEKARANEEKARQAENVKNRLEQIAAVEAQVAAEDERADRLMQFEMDIEKATDRRLAKEAAAEAKADAKKVKSHEKLLEKKKRAEEKAAEEQQARTEEGIALSMQLASVGLNTSMQLFDAVITGQGDAIDQILAANLKSTGQQVIGIGTKYVAEGIGLAALGAPNAGFVIAAGAAGVAAGAAMAGGGTAWGHLAAGGTIGKALPTGSSGSSSRGGKGVGSVRTGTSSAGGDATVTNTTNIFNGPTYDAIGTTRHLSRSRELESDLLQAQP